MTSHGKWRSAQVVVAGILSLIMTSCGYSYRPIVDVIPKPGGDPSASRMALVVNEGGTPGTTTQINVSGDSNMANFAVGRGPVHVSWQAATGFAFVANREGNNVSSYLPGQAATQVLTINLPPNSLPVFVHSSENASNGNCSDGTATNRTPCAYVVNSGTNSVGVIDTSLLLLRDTPIPVGSNPVALAETPDGRKLYVVNQGDGTVSVIRTSDRTILATINVGASPVWATMRDDGARLYVVNQASGSVSVIDTASDTIVDQLSVGAGPSHAFFDERLNRLWVANSGSNTVSVFAADVSPPQLLATVPVGSAPRAVVSLADGARAYVVNSGSNTVSVINSSSFSISKTISVGSNPVWIAASPDGSKVFVANRDSNTVSDIRTSDDSVVATVPTGSPNPVFITVTP